MRQAAVNKHLVHRNAKTGNEEPLRDHLELVAERAKEYAGAFGAAEERRLNGSHEGLTMHVRFVSYPLVLALRCCWGTATSGLTVRVSPTLVNGAETNVITTSYTRGDMKW